MQQYFFIQYYLHNFSLLIIMFHYQNKSQYFWHIILDLIGQMKKQKNTRSTKSKKSQPKSKKKTVTKQVTKTKSKNEKITVQKQQSSSITSSQYEIKLEGKKYIIKLHKNYQIDSTAEIGKYLINWIALLTKKQKLKQGNIYKITEFSYYPTFQFLLAGEKPQHDKCSICQFQYQSLSNQDMEKQLVTHNHNDLVMLKCSHMMHYQCLKQLVKDQDWVKCPVCASIYGKMYGDQPPGSMTYTVNKLLNCDGYPECGTITINYNMLSGKRGNINFPGTHRIAYLPDNKQGNQVLQLLKQAFQRKLIFTIGRSVTTGRDNQIVWNGIHHKTNISGGSAYFGYPDPTYFQRVKLQLAAKGIY